MSCRGGMGLFVVNLNVLSLRCIPYVSRISIMHFVDKNGRKAVIYKMTAPFDMLPRHNGHMVHNGKRWVREPSG